jgi:capsular exopolysaccharide synthesis family protein
MSRITEALRRRDGGQRTAAPEPSPSSLHQYGREERTVPFPDRSIDPAPRARVPAPAAAPPVARRRSGTNVESEARLVTSTSSTVSVEQYRRVAATLHEAQVENGLKTVMFTSALPGEGKTLTTVNLALTLSESYGRRVLVIDADLRAPSIHDALSLPNSGGLSEALQGEEELEFVKVSERLTVLPAGSPGPTPLAALTSGRMAQILEQCAAQFDWVLIDTPPIGVLPDAQVLARLAGAVVFVVGAGTSPVAAVQRAIAELGGPDAIFGVVLNRVEERRIPSATYYGHYQSSGSK